MKHNPYSLTRLLLISLGVFVLMPSMVATAHHTKGRHCTPGCEEWINFQLCTEIFDALSNKDNVTPPNPIIAAGHTQVIAMVNNSIAIFSKNQNLCSLEQTYQDSNQAFFKFATSSVSEPWLVYNEFLDKFFISGIISTNEGSEVFFAVSKDSQPIDNTDFYHYRFLIEGASLNNPKIAADNEALYLSTNLGLSTSPPSFDTTSQTVYAFDAQTLATGPDNNNISALFVDTINVYPVASISNNIQFVFPLQPRASQCPEVVEQVVFAETRILDPNSSSINGSTVRVHTYPNPLINSARLFVDVPVSPYIGLPTTPPTVEQPPPMINPLNEPIINIQTALLEINTGVVSNNSIWTAHSVVADGRFTNLFLTRWYEINIELSDETLTAHLKQSGTVDDESSSSQIWPSINVDKKDNMALQFTLVSPQQYPVIAYTGRRACDPAGTIRLPYQKAVGGDLYYQITVNVPFNPSLNPYGNYSGLAIDPCDGKTFWLFNQYPIPVTPSEDFPFGANWSTFIGSFKLDKCGISSNTPQVKSASPRNLVDA